MPNNSTGISARSVKSWYPAMMRLAFLLIVALAHTCSPLPSKLWTRASSPYPTPDPSTNNGDTQSNEILQNTMSIHEIMFQFNSTAPPSKESSKVLDQLSSLLTQLTASIDGTFKPFDGVEALKKLRSRIQEEIGNTVSVIQSSRSGESFQGQLQGAFQEISLATIKLLDAILEGQGANSGPGNPSTKTSVPVSKNLRLLLKDLTELWQSARKKVADLKIEYYKKQFPGISHTHRD